MRTIVLALGFMWGWYFFHDQVVGLAQHSLVATISWFGLDPAVYVGAARKDGFNGVAAQYSTDFSKEASRDLAAR